MDGIAYNTNKNAVAKGTTDDNVDTHRKMRHTQRPGSRTIDLIRRVHGRICRRSKISGGVQICFTHHPGWRREAEAGVWLSRKIKIGSLKVTQDGGELMVTVNTCAL